MPYIEKRSPAPRTEDTVLGKLNGWMQEYLFYLDKESQCAQIDAIIPDWFPLNYIQDGFIAIFKFVYESNYQKVYNEGANRGNAINNEVFGWVQGAKDELTRYTDKARSELQTIINDVKSKVGSLDSLVSDARTKISALDAQIRNFDVRLADATNRISRALSDAETALKRVNEVYTQILDHAKKIEDIYKKVLDHATKIDDLIRRVSALEKGMVAQPKGEKSLLDVLFGR